MNSCRLLRQRNKSRKKEKKTYKTPGVESYYARIEDVLQITIVDAGDTGSSFGGGSTQPARTKERNSWEEE